MATLSARVRALSARLVLTALILPLLVAAAVPTQPDRNPNANALWAGGSQGLAKYAAADGALLRALTARDDIHALAVDPRNGTVWISDGDILEHLAPDGTQLGSYTLSDHRFDDEGDEEDEDRDGDHDWGDHDRGDDHDHDRDDDWREDREGNWDDHDRDHRGRDRDERREDDDRDWDRDRREDDGGRDRDHRRGHDHNRDRDDDWREDRQGDWHDHDRGRGRDEGRENDDRDRDRREENRGHDGNHRRGHDHDHRDREDDRNDHDRDHRNRDHDHDRDDDHGRDDDDDWRDDERDDHRRGGAPVRLIADRATGGVWLIRRHDVIHFDPEVQPQARIEPRLPIFGAAFDTTRGRLWLATPRKLTAYNRDGEAVAELGGIRPAHVRALEYAPAQDALWIATPRHILRFASDTLDREARLRARGARHLAADGAGGLWSADHHRLRYFDAAGGLRLTLRRPLHHGRIIDLAANPADESTWLAGRHELVHIRADGTIAERLDLPRRQAPGRIAALGLFADLQAPTLAFSTAVDGALLADTTPALALTYTDTGGGADPATLTIDVGGMPLTITCNAQENSDMASAPQSGTATCTLTEPLVQGAQTLRATIADYAGNRSEPAEVFLTIDTIAPAITLDPPLDGTWTHADTLTIAGRLSEAATVHINGEVTELDLDRRFEQAVALTTDGAHAIELTAEDRAGNITMRAITVHRDTVAPGSVNLEGVTIEAGQGGDTVRVTGAVGSVEPGAEVLITNTRTGETIVVQADEQGAFTATVAGRQSDEYRITVRDHAGNESEPEEITGGHIPPDPEDIAPPLPETGTPPLAARVAFLYSGANPIQQSVAPGTIKERRVSILRGEVRDRSGAPLPGVKITILNHPELGHTYTQADGGFDLAVNGGGALTVVYEKDGYLPVQRTVPTQWNGWYFAGDVVLTRHSDKVTVIDLTDSSQPFQVARGHIVEDDAGPRQATLLFPAGTTATMTLPDGSKEQLSQLDIRITEYTVGETGPAAMPGELAPQIAYTYAVELSVDQVREQGMKVAGKGVVFNQEVPFYVDNFLKFPTGESVPVGYYNGDAGHWVPYENGRIVEILSIEDGKAVLDVTGDGDAATPVELEELGITPEEQAKLAELYVSGKSLWRVALSHLSTWDCNWPYSPPDDAEGPDVPEPETLERDEPDNSDETNQCDGCVISPQKQSLGESIPVAGTPFRLHYQSDRAAGAADNFVTIPLTDGDIPESLLAVKLSIDIAGRQFERSFAPEPNQSYRFDWDGYDAYGRPLLGRVEANITLSYEYNCLYSSPGNNEFGGWGGPAYVHFKAMEGVSGGAIVYCDRIGFSQRSTVMLESPHKPPKSMGNWSLSVQHVLNKSMLLRGDGAQRPAALFDLARAAGTRSWGLGPSEGALAVEVAFNYPSTAIASDGNLYIVHVNHGVKSAIWRVEPNGRLDRVAEAVSLLKPRDLAVGPDGNIYIADTGHHRVLRIAPDGIVHTVAGTGEPGYGGDGGTATQAQLNYPSGIAVGLDGSVYIADRANHRIRRVAPDGTIHTVAGTGTRGNGGDGGSARAAQLSMPNDVEIGPDGSVYIADSGNDLVRRVAPDGTIFTTTTAVNSPNDIAIGVNGSLYVVNGIVARRVAPGGRVSTVIDHGHDRIASLAGIAIGPGGDIYIEATRAIWRRYQDDPGQRSVLSGDGIRLFVFDDAGRHLRTVSTRTNEALYRFERNAEGHLIAITDGAGNITRIERDVAGRVAAIIAPDGQRTALTIGSNGYLTAVTDPTGAAWSMAYTGDGLMTRFTDRDGATNTFTYNAIGRLVRDNGPGGSGWTLARQPGPDGYAVMMTSGAGRTSGFALLRPEDGTRTYLNMAPDGTVTRRTHTDAGDTTIQHPNGTIVERSEAPSPRFGWDAPFVQHSTVTLPSGLQRVATRNRSVHLTGVSSPLEPAHLTRALTINGRTTQTVYDGATHTWTTTSPAGRQVTITTDEIGRPVRTQAGPFAPVERVYDDRGRLIETRRVGEEGTRTTQLTYHDAGAQAGYLATTADALGRTTTFEHDALGRVTEQTLPGGRTIGFAYDPEGRLTQVDPPGQPVHVMTYGAKGNRTEYNPPDIGTQADVTRYRFNADDQITAVERPSGQTVTFGYDTGGRLSQRSGPAGTTDYAYYPDTGQLATIDAPGGIGLAFEWDGSLPTKIAWNGPVAGTVKRSYGDNFWVTGLSVGGHMIERNHDLDGLLTQAGALTIGRSDVHSGVTSLGLGVIGSTFAYNDFAELAGVQHGAPVRLRHLDLYLDRNTTAAARVRITGQIPGARRLIINDIELTVSDAGHVTGIVPLPRLGSQALEVAAYGPADEPIVYRWIEIERTAPDLDFTVEKVLAASSNGDVYVRASGAYSGIWRIPADTGQPEQRAAWADADAVTVSPEGGLFWREGARLYRDNGAAGELLADWSARELAPAGSVAVAPDGVVFVTIGPALYRLAGGSLVEIVRVPEGELEVVASDVGTLLQLSGSALLQTPPDGSVILRRDLDMPPPESPDERESFEGGAIVIDDETLLLGSFRSIDIVPFPTFGLALSDDGMPCFLAPPRGWQHPIGPREVRCLGSGATAIGASSMAFGDGKTLYVVARVYDAPDNVNRLYRVQADDYEPNPMPVILADPGTEVVQPTLHIDGKIDIVTTLLQAAYQRDAIGRITDKTVTVDGEPHTVEYTYDQAGRLTRVTRDGTPIHIYEYDTNGNRIRHLGQSGEELATYDAQDRLKTYGNATYTHTPAGARKTTTTTAGTTTYDYDVAGNLRSVQLPGGTTIEYLIDGMNRRIGKKVNGQLQNGWLYRDALNPIAQLNGNGEITHRFVYANKANAPAYMIKIDPDTGNETTYRIISNHLGSVRLVVNAETGVIAQRIDYSPFGKVINDTNPGFQPFGFAGGLYDQHTKLTRFGARDYDAEVGRWTAKDPILFRGGTMNLYGYVVNDPINLIDPFGLEGSGPGMLQVMFPAHTAMISQNPIGGSPQAQLRYANFVNGVRGAIGATGAVATVGPLVASAGPAGGFVCRSLTRAAVMAPRAGFSRLPASMQSAYAGNSARVLTAVQDVVAYSASGAPPGSQWGTAAIVAKSLLQ